MTDEFEVEVDGIRYEVYRYRSGRWAATRSDGEQSSPVERQSAIDAAVNKAAAQACPFWEDPP